MTDKSIEFKKDHPHVRDDIYVMTINHTDMFNGCQINHYYKQTIEDILSSKIELLFHIKNPYPELVSFKGRTPIHHTEEYNRIHLAKFIWKGLITYNFKFEEFQEAWEKRDR